MSETHHFSWLHLTDFHYGLGGLNSPWPTLRAPFLEDLEKLHRLSGPWQAVLFTGDLVQSGSPSQFQEMQREVLDRIWAKLNDLGSGDAALLAVPGNHDLQRPEKNGDSPARDMLLLDQGFAKVADRFWSEPESDYRKLIKTAFGAYEAWWGGTKQKPRSGLANGLLPGDFAYTLRCGHRKIGLMGLIQLFYSSMGATIEGVWRGMRVKFIKSRAARLMIGLTITMYHFFSPTKDPTGSPPRPENMAELR